MYATVALCGTDFSQARRVPLTSVDHVKKERGEREHSGHPACFWHAGGRDFEGGNASVTYVDACAAQNAFLPRDRFTTLCVVIADCLFPSFEDEQVPAVSSRGGGSWFNLLFGPGARKNKFTWEIE